MLALVCVLNGSVVERDILDRDISRAAGDAVVRDDDVLHRDAQVLDRFVVARSVWAEADQSRFSNLLPSPAQLQKVVGSVIEILRERQVLMRRLFDRAAARAR